MRKTSIPLIMVLSSLLVCGVAGITYIALTFFITAAIARIIAYMILGTLIPVYRYLRDKEIELSIIKASEVGVDIKRHTLKWYLIIIYGSLILSATVQFSAGALGFFVGSSVAIIRRVTRYNERDYIMITSILMQQFTILIQILIRPFAAFILGSWVAKKGIKYNIPVMFFTLSTLDLVNILGLILAPDFIIASQFLASRSEFIIKTIQAGIIFFIISIPFALLGYKFGRRRKLIAQLQSLFRVLPHEVQVSVVDLVQKAVVKVPVNSNEPQWLNRIY